MIKVCEICGSGYTKTPRESYRQFEGKRFCSLSCASKYKYTQKNFSNWRGGKSMAGKYVYLFMPNHRASSKKGYVAEHRYVYETYHEMVIPKGMEVHHINGNHTDNSIDNLKLLSKSEHARFHALQNGLGKHKRK